MEERTDPRSQGGRFLHVLVAAARDGVRQFVRDVLEDEFGAHVMTASGGDEAREALRCIKFHLVVLDVDMPGLSATAVLTALRGTGSVTPVLIVSNGGGFADEARALGASFLAKPMAPEALIGAVHCLLEQGRASNIG